MHCISYYPIPLVGLNLQLSKKGMKLLGICVVFQNVSKLSLRSDTSMKHHCFPFITCLPFTFDLSQAFNKMKAKMEEPL